MKEIQDEQLRESIGRKMCCPKCSEAMKVTFDDSAGDKCICLSCGHKFLYKDRDVVGDAWFG